jgi:hypothetical protein
VCVGVGVGVGVTCAEERKEGSMSVFTHRGFVSWCALCGREEGGRELGLPSLNACNSLVLFDDDSAWLKNLKNLKS